MSRPFAKKNGNSTFAQLNEPQDAGDYIANKKIKS